MVQSLHARRSSPLQPGTLSARYESGTRGPGAVSSGRNDPGGVSYGLYQLASRTGAVAAFLTAEGCGWAAELAAGAPGSPAFSAAWQAIAAREPEAFAAAQHGFIARTHFQPVIATVAARTGLDCAARSAALRDVCWSCAVQHGAAARIIAGAIGAVEAGLPRSDRGFDAALIRAIYAARTAYVQRVASRLASGERAALLAMAARRYPAECAAALAMLAAERDGPGLG